jgi:hypothetical protein
MNVERANAGHVLNVSRAALGLPPNADRGLDDVFLAASLRRTAGILCPCPPSSIVGVALQSLHHLVEDVDAIRGRIEDLLEKLVAGGDFLELGSASLGDTAARSTWLFAAPPSFVERPDHAIAIIGVAPDEASPLPEALASRILYEGASRTIIPLPSEKLVDVFRQLGLLELSLAGWLKTPRHEPASQLVAEMRRLLAAQGPSGDVTDMAILDHGRRATHYPDRWTAPSAQTGEYVARRPHTYGAPLWGFASLAEGRVTKFLDFPLKRSVLRGCDTAWHLQMALDHLGATPQVYRRRRASGGTCLDFFSPLPQWALRRLSAFGLPASPEHCLVSFLLSDPLLASEEAFLQDRLWLVPQV